MNEDNRKLGIAEKISSSFFKGLLILLPPVITIFVVGWMFEFSERNIGKILPIKIPGVGLLIVVSFICVIGLLSGNFFSKKIIELLERFLGKIPFVKFIYSSIKQISKALFGSETMFQKVVLVPYQQSYVLGFLMPDIPKPIDEKLNEDFVCVFIPWSLNVTSGINLFVKSSTLIFIDMTSQDALQFILTAGMNSSEISISPIGTKKDGNFRS